MNSSLIVRPERLLSLITDQKSGPLEIKFILRGYAPLFKLREEMLVIHPKFGEKKFEITALERDFNNGQTKIMAVSLKRRHRKELDDIGD